MKRHLKFLTLGLAVSSVAVLAACGGSDGVDTGNGPYKSVDDLVDTRTVKYAAYDVDGTEEETFTSMYSAINYVVNNMDDDAFVSEIGELNKKLFVNYKEFREDSKDMFWYYKNGTQLAEYTPWVDTYWGDLLAHEDVTIVFKSGESGTVGQYYNSAEIIKVADNTGVTGITQPGVVMPWHADMSYQYEVFSSVDMHAYSGITKSEYEVELSKARIAPSLTSEDQVYAMVGFKTADSYHSSNMGIACDTQTGKWYYFSGENGSTTVDTTSVVLESTWNTNGYWMPNSNVTVTAEIILDDGTLDGDVFHRFTAKSGSKTLVTKDYETSGISSDATLKFTSGLDVITDNGMADYTNGAYMENLVITKATGTVTQDAIDGETYGNMTALEEAGTYDLLNSNPQSKARFHTVLFSAAYIDVNFDTAGKDIYSYNLSTDNEESFTSDLDAALDALIAVAQIADVTESNRSTVEAARALYDALKPTEQTIMTSALYEKLVAAENKLGTV